MSCRHVPRNFTGLPLMRISVPRISVWRKPTRIANSSRQPPRSDAVIALRKHIEIRLLGVPLLRRGDRQGDFHLGALPGTDFDDADFALRRLPSLLGKRPGELNSTWPRNACGDSFNTRPRTVIVASR